MGLRVPLSPAAKDTGNEADERAEAELVAPAPDDQALNPASRSCRLDEQVEPVAVRVYSRRGGAHKGGRQGLVGVTSLVGVNPHREHRNEPEVPTERPLRIAPPSPPY